MDSQLRLMNATVQYGEREVAAGCRDEMKHKINSEFSVCFNIHFFHTFSLPFDKKPPSLNQIVRTFRFYVQTVQCIVQCLLFVPTNVDTNIKFHYKPPHVSLSAASCVIVLPTATFSHQHKFDHTMCGATSVLTLCTATLASSW